MCSKNKEDGKLGVCEDERNQSYKVSGFLLFCFTRHDNLPQIATLEKQRSRERCDQIHLLSSSGICMYMYMYTCMCNMCFSLNFHVHVS